MKKLLFFAGLIGGVVGTLAYINKNGLPIIGNITMHLPIKLKYDGWDLFTAALMFADGKIARRFHMVSELGKVLDPIADKLTQAVVALCLCWDYPGMKLLLIVLVIKELGQGFYGLYMYRLTGHNVSSMWCGKITTFYLYAMMVLFLLVPGLPEGLILGLILLGVGLLIWSFISYLTAFRRIVRDAKIQEEA